MPKKIGSGVYGNIYPTTWQNKDVVIKQNLTSKRSSFIGSIRELDILSRLSGHPYIVKLLGLAEGQPIEMSSTRVKNIREDHIFFVFERASTDLYRFLRQKSPSFSVLKHLMVNLLLGIEYCHQNGIIHRDLKPENLLVFVNDGIKLKICDFGLSMPYAPSEDTPDEIVTPWYRAPEVCQADPRANFPMDMWSVGCILYEMLTNRALLNGSKITDKQLLINIGRNLPVDLKFKPHELDSFNKSAGSMTDFMILLNGLLEVDPAKRWSAEKALNSKFFDFDRKLIDKVRSTYKLSKIENLVNMSGDSRYQPIQQFVKHIVAHRRQNSWFNFRIIFHTIDMYSRWIDRLAPKDVDLAMRVLLYIAYKYFSTFRPDYGFSEIIQISSQNTGTLNRAKELERIFIFDICDNKVYRPTVYEDIPMGTSEDAIIVVLNNYLCLNRKIFD